MAVAWILRDGIVTSVLIGASKVSQIEDNVKALDNIHFSEEELAAIDEVLKGQKIRGWDKTRQPICKDEQSLIYHLNKGSFYTMVIYVFKYSQV